MVRFNESRNKLTDIAYDIPNHWIMTLGHNDPKFVHIFSIFLNLEFIGVIICYIYDMWFISIYLYLKGEINTQFSFKPNYIFDGPAACFHA